MTKEEEHKLFLYGGVGGAVVIGGWFLFHPGAPQVPTKTRGATHATQVTKSSPNPQQGPLEEAVLAARDQALQTYDTTVLGEQSNTDQLQAIQNEDLTQKLISFNSTAAQLKETGLTTAAEQSIAEAEAAAQEQVASTQANAAQNIASSQQQAQQGSWWQNLFGGLLGGLGGIFGFNQASSGGMNLNIPWLNPVGYGTGEVWDNSLPWIGEQYNLPDIPDVQIPDNTNVDYGGSYAPFGGA